MVKLEIYKGGYKFWTMDNLDYAYLIENNEQEKTFYIFSKSYFEEVKGCKNKAEYYRLLKLKAFL